MREPEFLPQWYVRNLESARRRRALIRAAAVACAAGGLWLASSPRTAPAELNPPAAAARPRSPEPHVAAARALDVVRRTLPTGAVILSISADSGPRATTVELRCVADDAEAAQCFAAALRATGAFSKVHLEARRDNIFLLRLSAPAGDQR